MHLYYLLNLPHNNDVLNVFPFDVIDYALDACFFEGLFWGFLLELGKNLYGYTALSLKLPFELPFPLLFLFSFFFFLLHSLRYNLHLLLLLFFFGHFFFII